MNVNQACAISATTPVTQTPPSLHDATRSPFQAWNTMKGKVWIKAKTNIAHATQLCQTFNFSWEMPVSAVIGFALAPKTLYTG